MASPDLAQRDKTAMKYFTYVLLSLNNGDLYIGSSEDLENRIKLHNTGRVKSTKAYCPWKLLEYKEFTTRSEAFRHERFLKTHQQKEILREKNNLIK